MRFIHVFAQVFAQVPGFPPAPQGDTFIGSLLGWVLGTIVLLVVALGGGVWALMVWFMSTLEKQRADGIAATERQQAKHDLQMKEARDKHDAEMRDKREKHDAIERLSREEFIKALKEQKDACKEELASANAADEARMRMVMEQMTAWRAESLAESKQMRETTQLMITKMAEMELRRAMEGGSGERQPKPKGGS